MCDGCRYSAVMYLFLLILFVFSPLSLWLVMTVRKHHASALTALIGILSGFVSLALAAFIPVFPAGGFFVPAAVEEAVKFLVLFTVMYHAVSDRNLASLPWLGLGAALAFGTAENAGYVLFSVDGGFFLAFARMFSSLVLHSACGILAGAAVCRLRSRTGTFILPFIGAVALHTFYNGMVLFGPWGLSAALASAVIAVLLLGKNFLK